MIDEPLSQVLILLAGAVFVVALTRRLGLPSILGYLFVGMALGPYAIGLIDESSTTQLLADLGVTFLLFTLGLEFSFPRMVAMRKEVFGLGMLQVLATSMVFAAIAYALGVRPLAAFVIGGALTMSSTALILHQLTDRGELNRTHGRLAFSMLLFQDLAFVPLLALGSVIGRAGETFSVQSSIIAFVGGGLAVVVALFAGRLLLRPLFQEIARSRLRELFTLAVLLVVLGFAWVSHHVGLSLALGGFLSGMMLAETEYRHQVESVIRPFRDILLGLFFITVGMLLDLRLVYEELLIVSLLTLGFVVLKAAVTAAVTRLFIESTFKAIRTGVVMSVGGEFGIALFTIVLQGSVIPAAIGQLLLVSIVLSMVLSPVVLNNNKYIARFLLRETGPPRSAMDRELAATVAIALREHVILCGFGRVGQNVARVLESEGYEYIALDLDPARIRAARQAGDPVIYGDSADEQMLIAAGLDKASVVVISFSDPATSVSILRSVRRMRADVPVLVRTADDARLEELKQAGATEVVPETFEASLTLVSQALTLLHAPLPRVIHAIGEIRANRYSVLRNVLPREDARTIQGTNEYREEIKSIVIPPGAWAVGRTLDDIRSRGAEVAITGIRRQGILGKEPGGATVLREGDIVVVYGQPDALEHAEAVLLAG